MAFKKRAKKAPETFHFEHFEEKGGTMRMGNDMRNLAQEIVNSFDARVERVAALRQETVERLNGFRQVMKNLQRELRRKAADLKRFLGNAETSRMRDFRAMHQGIQARQEERNGEVAAMRGRFHREQKAIHREMGAMAGHWRTLAFTMARKRAATAR